MSRYSQVDISSIAGTNAELQKIEAAIDTMVDRDGTAPNSMNADLDLNSNDLLNGANVYATKIYVNGSEITATGVDAGASYDWTGQHTYTLVPTISGNDFYHQGNLEAENLDWTGTHTFTTDLTVNGNTVLHEGNLDSDSYLIGVIEGSTLADYTPTVADQNKIKLISRSLYCNYTIPAGVFPIGATLSVLQTSTGEIKFIEGAGVGILSELDVGDGVETKARYAFATAVHLYDYLGTEYWGVTGSLVATPP